MVWDSHFLSVSEKDNCDDVLATEALPNREGGGVHVFPER